MLIYVQVYHEYIRNIWVRVLQYFFEFLSFVGTTLFQYCIVLYRISRIYIDSTLRCPYSPRGAEVKEDNK
jgi:hypothetical protein